MSHNMDMGFVFSGEKEEQKRGKRGTYFQVNKQKVFVASLQILSTA